MPSLREDLIRLVRRSKLFVPVNRENFVAKAWAGGADCIILDLEDAIAIVKKGRAEVQVGINREFEEEDLDAIVHPGLDGVMISKCESAEEIQRIDGLVSVLERERGLPIGRIYFDLIVESAIGVVNIDSIAKASPRIQQMNIGQGDLSADMGFPRVIELNFEQYFYAESRLLYAARAAGVQACGLGAQNGVDFTSVSLGEEAMLRACQHAQWMGFMGASIIHPGWVKAVNEGFKQPAKDLEMAREVKAALVELSIIMKISPFFS